MNTSAPANYAIRIDGHLGEHCSASLVGMSIIRDSDGTTTIAGPVADQDQLHQVIARLGDAGTTLLEVHTDRQRTAETRIHTQPDMPPVLDRALHSERLTLRPAVLSDAEATWTFRQLSVVNEWLTGCPADIASYRELWGDPERLATTVVVQLAEARGAHVIGDFMLSRENASAQLDMAEQARSTQAELGFLLDPAHSGYGYATEAVRELLRYSFEDLGVRRVVASCFLDNDTSWRLMERVGMRRETHAIRQFLHSSGRWLDTVGYALLSEEWKVG